VTPLSRDDETGGSRLAAEEFARELLKRPAVTSDDIVRLRLALPSELPSRGSGSKARSVSLGAFAFSGSQHLLVRDTSKQYPLSTQVFARFIRQLSKDFTCTTIAVFTNLRTPLHQDTANEAQSRNLLFPLTSFSEGGVWCESSTGKVPFEHRGSVLLGEVLNVSEGLCFLDAPNRRHATLPWEGERCLLVGYTAQGAHVMPRDTRAYLERLGFPLPPAANVPIPKPSLPAPTAPDFQADAAPLFVEIFAGCARLSKHCRALGFDTLAIDSPWNHHKPEHPLLVLDLHVPTWPSY